MTRSVAPACVMLVTMTLVSCANSAPGPSTIRLGEDACASCRMAIVSIHNAAQIVAPGAEPIMFDEVGCLRDHLAATPLPDGALVFVADHRTGEWVDARHAVFTQTRVATPMSSGLLAHSDSQSRDADRQAVGGTAIAAETILGSHLGSIQP